MCGNIWFLRCWCGRLLTMSTSVRLKCVCLPCDLCDFGSQRCRIDRNTFERLSVAIGDFVQISLESVGAIGPERTAICRAFLRKDIWNDVLQIDESVCIWSSPQARKHWQKCSISINPLERGKVSVLEVIVVMDRDCLVKRFKNDLLSLREYVRELLAGFGVVKGCSVSFPTKKAATILGIKSIKVVGGDDLKPQQVIVVSEKTSVTVMDVMSQERYDQENKVGYWHKPSGLEHEEQLLKDSILPLWLPKSASRLALKKVTGTLLIGESGTGKTSLVYRVAKDCNAEVVHVTGSDLYNPHPGESEKLFRDIFEKAARISDDSFCILFLDKLETIGGRRNQVTSTSSSRLLAQLLMLLDGVKSYDKLIVLGSTSKPYDLDPAVRRPGRFDREIILGLPNQQERLQILNALTAAFPLCEDVNLQNVANCTSGYSGADLALLCQQVAVVCIQQKQHGFPQSSFHKAVCSFRPSTQTGCSYITSDLRRVHWSDIGGLEGVKQQLKQIVELPLHNPSAMKYIGLAHPKGVLLYGPPGCCKTTLVRAVATAVSLPFVCIGPAQIYSPFVGDSEKTIAEIFKKARSLAPCILFLDEVDALVGSRSSQQHRGVHEKILSTLLNEMDGIGIRFDEKQTRQNDVKLQPEGHQEAVLPEQHTTQLVDNAGIFVVAATNRPDLVDKALLRPGRFDRLLYIPPPDYIERCSILESVTKQMPLGDVDFKLLARQTEYFSGADLENLCREAALLAIHEDGVQVSCIRQCHFQNSLNRIQPSLSKEQLGFYKDFY